MNRCVLLLSWYASLSTGAPSPCRRAGALAYTRRAPPPFPLLPEEQDNPAAPLRQHHDRELPLDEMRLSACSRRCTAEQIPNSTGRLAVAAHRQPHREQKLGLRVRSSWYIQILEPSTLTLNVLQKQPKIEDHGGRRRVRIGGE